MSFVGIEKMDPNSSVKSVTKRLTRELFDAALSGDVDKVEKLVKTDIDINATNDNGYTVLQAVAQKTHTNPITRHNSYNFITVSYDDYLTTAELLIKHGALIDTKALVFSCKQKSSDMLSILIKNSTADTIKENGYKLLKTAIQSTSIDSIETLISHGALTDLSYSNLKNIELLSERLPFSSTPFIHEALNEALNAAFNPLKAGDSSLVQLDNNVNESDLSPRQKLKFVSTIFNAITTSRKATMTKDHKKNLMARLQKSQQKVQHGF